MELNGPEWTEIDLNGQIGLFGLVGLFGLFGLVGHILDDWH